jgi:hypothetical protein
MKRAIAMTLLLIYPRLLVAQEFDLESLTGEWWYGLYLSGQKAGYSRSEVRRDSNGDIVVLEDARFQANMVGVKQDMAIYSERRYGADGALKTIVSKVKDPAQVSEFVATVDGDDLRVVSSAGGATKESIQPKPKESLVDALKHAHWIQGHPQVGDRLTFSTFDPMFEREIEGASEIVAVEGRFLDGVETTMYRIKTRLEAMGIESEAVVLADGTTLEDTVAGMIVMRLEPEDVAKDVSYNNDVIVSNAAMLDTPIGDPRTRASLRLRLHGPLGEDHLFNDLRQTVRRQGDAVIFEARRPDTAALPALVLPIENPDVLRWRQATAFVQSDEAKIIDKAREILGGETDALKASALLCTWVFQNVRNTYSARLTNALEVLDSLEGDCTEHSILFIALARAAGLPAREVAGLIYVDYPRPGFYFHQWAKVWAGEWIDVDPTFNQPLADVTHIKLAEGDHFQQTRLIPVIGNLKVDVLDADASPAEAAPAVGPNGAPVAAGE